MLRFHRIWISDFLKIRRTPLLWVHLLLPLLAAGGMVGYASISPLNTLNMTVIYMELLGVALPLVIGVVTGMVTEQEAAAGGFQNLLTGPSPKWLALLSKLCLLILMSLVSLLLAVGGFGAGLTFISNREASPWNFYLLAACVLAGSSIILYIVHLVISLRFGQGASIGLGITGSLLAALLLTGLGDGIWTFMPHSWPARLSVIWVLYAGDPSVSGSSNTGVCNVLWTGTLSMSGLFLLACTWFTLWEGRKSET